MDPTSEGELWVANLACDFEPMEVSSVVMDTQPISKGVDDAAHKVICPTHEQGTQPNTLLEEVEAQLDPRPNMPSRT